MTVKPTGRVLRPVVSDEDMAQQLIDEAMRVEADDYVAKVYEFIREAEKENENKPLAHFRIPIVHGGKAPSKDQTSFFEWKRPGNRQASRTKRYGRWCEI